MAGREISVKKYVVKLSAEEREQLEAMICAGKHPAQSLTKARILLKADVAAVEVVIGGKCLKFRSRCRLAPLV